MPPRSERQSEPDAKPRDGWSKLYTRDVADYAARTLGVAAAFVLSRHLCELGTREHGESLRSLAAAMGMHRDTVRRATDALCADGLLSRDPAEPKGRERCTYSPGARLLAVVNGEAMAYEAGHSPETMTYGLGQSPEAMAYQTGHNGLPDRPNDEGMAYETGQNGLLDRPPSRESLCCPSGSSRDRGGSGPPAASGEPQPADEAPCAECGQPDGRHAVWCQAVAVRP